MSSTADNVLIDINERLFYISDFVDSASMGKMCFNLLCLLQQDNENEKEKKNFERKPIRIYVNSGGGDVYDMWALIDIIEKSKTPIYTYCTGYAMSAGFKIFLAGHKRFATRHATFMFHQMSSIESGKYQDLVEAKKELDFTNKQIEQYVIEKTNISQDYIDNIRKTKQDVYIHSDEALKLGFIDEIV